MGNENLSTYINFKLLTFRLYFIKSIYVRKNCALNKVRDKQGRIKKLIHNTKTIQF